jgi:hypothetical protein
MSEELEVIAETLETAPELEQTVDNQVTEETEQQEQEEAKRFSQEELDRAISKRLAREQRKWEREQAAKTERVPVESVDVSQYESTEEYAVALAEKLLEQREKQKQYSEVLESYIDREEEARSKYDDYQQVVYNDRLMISDAMAEAIRSADNGPDIAYHLGSNPKEAERIARLSPLLQAKEIGRIEAKLSDEPPATKQTTRAPAPISPVGSARTTSTSVETTDPRSIKTMTTSQWIEAERQRQIRNWEAKNRR